MNRLLERVHDLLGAAPEYLRRWDTERNIAQQQKTLLRGSDKLHR